METMNWDSVGKIAGVRIELSADIKLWIAEAQRISSLFSCGGPVPLTPIQVAFIIGKYRASTHSKDGTVEVGQSPPPNLSDIEHPMQHAYPDEPSALASPLDKLAELDSYFKDEVAGALVEFREVKQIIMDYMRATNHHCKKRIGHYCEEALIAQSKAAALAAELAKPRSEKPLPTPEQLLQVARDTGLRSYLHGVNATDAREILATYVDAVRWLDTGSASAPAAAPAGV